MVPVFALLLAAGCSDSFESFQGDLQQLVASPSQLFLQVGETKTVEVSGVDAQGNPLTFDYQVTSTGSGINVRRDSTFLPVYVDDTTLQVPPQAERYRFIVEGTGYGATQFVVSAGGQDLTIPVQVVPQSSIEATFSNATPALGETVTITAPAGTRFSPTSTVTVPGDVQPVVVSIDPSGASMNVILPPNLTDAQLTISEVTTDAAPGVVFAPTTTATLTTPAVTSFPGTISNLTPAVNEEVTVTLTDATFAPDASLLLGAATPVVTGIAGNTLTFVPAPGATGLLTVNGVVLNVLPQIPLILPAPETDTMTVSSEPPPEIAGTGSPGTAPALTVPAVGLGSVVYDNPATFGGSAFDFPTRWYEITLTEETALTITLEWATGEDLGGYIFESDGATLTDFDPADAHGEGGDASPETVTNVMPAGTYLLGVLNFSATNPPLLGITLHSDAPTAEVRMVATSRAAPGKLLKR